MLWEESIMFEQINFSDRHTVTASHVQHHRTVCLFYIVQSRADIFQISSPKFYLQVSLFLPCRARVERPSTAPKRLSPKRTPLSLPGYSVCRTTTRIMACAAPLKAFSSFTTMAILISSCSRSPMPFSNCEYAIIQCIDACNPIPIDQATTSNPAKTK